MADEIVEPDEEANEKVTHFVDRLIESGEIKFDETGRLRVWPRELGQFYYQAILEGFGFPPGFVPSCSNTLNDDIENEYDTFYSIISKLDLNDEPRSMECVLDRTGFETAMRFWYKMGGDAKRAEFGFPWWSDGVSAEEYMAMSEKERMELSDQD